MPSLDNEAQRDREFELTKPWACDDLPPLQGDGQYQRSGGQAPRQGRPNVALGHPRAAESGLCPLPIEWFAEVTPTLDGRWLVKGLVPARAFVMIYGHPGSGKTFLAFDLALHLAMASGGRADVSWMGRRVKGGLVIYIAAEGQSGLRLRLEAFRRQNPNLGDLPFALVPAQIDLLAKGGDMTRLIATIEAACARFALPVAMVVIDTLSRTFGGGDEIGPDMVAYIANLGRLQAHFECAVLAVHHRPKNSENETPRGHGSLWGALDTVLLVEDKGTVKIARVTKQKDGEQGDPILFKLHSVHLGADEDGEPVSSCVVEAAMDMPIPSTSTGLKLNSTQIIVRNALGKALEDNGVFPPRDTLDGIVPLRVLKVAKLSEWRSRALSSLHRPDLKPDTARRQFERGVNKLQSLGVVGIHDGWVWLS